MSGTERFGELRGTRDSVALHDRTVDRLLVGTLGAGDVPPGYQPVADLVRVAAGPPTQDELGDEEAAVALLVDRIAAAAPVVPPPALAPAARMPGRAPVATPGPAVTAAVWSARARRADARTPTPGRWAGRGTRVAAVAVALLVGVGGGLAALGGDGKGPPTISAEPAPGRDRSATIQGTQGPPLSEPTSATPTTIARPPAAIAPPATSPPPPPVVAAPVVPAPTAPPAPVARPPATATPPTTAPPLPEECADIERLPAGMREGLDRMARGFGFPNFTEMCRVGAQQSSGPSAGSGGATGDYDWWSGSSPRRR